jgi:hypothetical protein
MKHDDETENLAPLDERTRRLLASVAAPRDLPAGLRSRLLALPASAEAEDENVRRYERARAAGLAAARTGLPEDLPSRTERAIAGLVAASRRPAALPAALRSRLLGIGRAARKPLPFWLIDVRYAAAACLILTLVSTVLVEDASALIGQRAAEAKVAGQQWQVRLGESATQGREDALAGLTRGWHRGRQIVFSRAEAVRDLFEEKLRIFNQTELGRRLKGETQPPGDDHGSR